MKEHRNPTINADEIDFSGIDTWLRCGKQYEFRYIKKMKEPPVIALIEGSSHHRSLEYNNNNKIKRGLDLKASVLTDKFQNHFDSGIKEREINWKTEKEKRDEILFRAQILHKKYCKNIAPLLKPSYAEKKFERKIKFDDKLITLYGTVDLVTKSRILYDYKVTKYAKSQSDADNSLQLSYYALGLNLEKAAFISFTKGNFPDVIITRTIRTQEQINWSLKVLKEVVNMISSGRFPLTNPSNWWCSQRFCGYWKYCRGQYVDH